jgi:general stress protein 26
MAEETKELPDHETVERVWQLAEKIDFCMFVTWDGERSVSRPLSSRVRRDDGAIYFLVSAEGCKNWQVETYPTVNLAYADTGAMKFISVSGTARLGNDRALIGELWSNFDKAWWKDAADPDIRVITVTPQTAELWDSPNKAVAMVSMVAAALTGATPAFGDHGRAHL